MPSKRIDIAPAAQQAALDALAQRGLVPQRMSLAVALAHPIKSRLIRAECVRQALRKARQAQAPPDTKRLASGDQTT